MELHTSVAIDGTPLVDSNKAIPFGLMEKTFFNDTYTFSINNESIDFIVWMRPSVLPNPRKLWGKIDRDLKKGDIISIDIKNNYNVSAYEGKKKLF